MKILRVRRGFTTNSSGSNEFVPPAPAPVADGTTTPAAVTNTIRPSPVSAIPMTSHTTVKDTSGTSASAEGVHAVTVRTSEMTSTAQAQQSGSTTKPSVPAPNSNAFVLLLVAVGVMLLFVIERVVRLLRRKYAGKEDESNDE